MLSILRWTMTILFLLTLVGMLVFLAYGVLLMSRIAVALKRDQTEREVAIHLNQQLLTEIVKRPLFPIAKADEPPTMGCDFGIGRLFSKGWF